MPIKWPYLVFLILLLGVLSYLFYPTIENFFIFFPERNFDRTPKDLNLRYTEVHLNAEDGKRLHGWFFPLEEDSPVILFFHGNAGNISHRLDIIRLLLKNKLQVFIIDYRGYGKSSGQPSEKGLYKDGLAAYEYLVKEKHILPEQIVLFGRSLGAAVATDVALKKNVRSIILESAFTSTKDMARTMVFFSLFSYFLPTNYNNLKKMPQVNVPKLIVHGEEDDVVPFSMGRKLFDASKDPKYFYRIKGAGHNDTYVVGGNEYFQTLARFIRDSRL